jgi:hypothetical protein
MIDTAKPTPGPYKLQISSTQPLALWSDDANGVILEAKWRHGFPPQRDLPCEEAIKNLSLAQKAFETYHETGLTPRQLLDQRDELQLALNEIANSKFCNYDETSHGNYAGQYGIGVTDGHRFCANIANAALAKCGKAGE